MLLKHVVVINLFFLIAINYFNYFFLCSILNESIPKDEADQLLQDLFHEMSMYKLKIFSCQSNPHTSTGNNGSTVYQAI